MGDLASPKPEDCLFSFLVSIFEEFHKKNNPTISNIIPIGNTVKKPSSGYPYSTNVVLTISTGGVPISVIIPPMLAAKAIGIKKRRALRLASRVMLNTMGSRRVAVPAFDIKEPNTAASIIVSIKSLSSLSPAV